MRSRIALACLVPVLLALAAGCSEPRYEATRACSLPSDLVAEVVGTDRFTAPTDRIEGFPFSDASLRGSRGESCRIDAGDASLLTRALIVPSTEMSRHVAELEALPGDHFDLLGGTAAANERDAGWACGSVWLTVNLSGDEAATPATMRAVLEALAPEISCYTAPDAAP